jgi:hypothetical protein
MREDINNALAALEYELTLDEVQQPDHDALQSKF